jgi:orotate phosphoribosyltransferase
MSSAFPRVMKGAGRHGRSAGIPPISLATSGYARGPGLAGSVCSTAVTDREELLAGIKAKGVVHGDFQLSSGARATSYVDLRRVTLDGRLAPLVGRVLLAATTDLSYDAVGGLTLGADPVATAMLHAAANRGTPIDAFVVRKAEKAHGLQRRIEGPDLEPGERCLIVEDVVTTGGSTVQAIEAVREAGHEICGVVAILDRLAGGADAIRSAAGGAPYEALATIDDVYPDRPDRA